MGRSPHRRLVVLLAVVALAAYALDQLTKAAAVALLTPGEVVPVLGDLLQLRLIRNPGAAFSLGTGMTWILTVFAVVVVVAVLRVARRLGSRAWAVALGLLLAGATGNLTDRLVRAPGFARGHVVDFLELPNWPIFNIADSAICVAAVLVVVLAVRGVDVDGRRAGRTSERAGDRATASGDASTDDGTDVRTDDRTDVRSTTPGSPPDAAPSQEHTISTSPTAPPADAATTGSAATGAPAASPETPGTSGADRRG